MTKTQANEVCPRCHGRGMYRPPGEWHNETCPRCDGSGYVSGTTGEEDQAKAPAASASEDSD